MNKWFATAVAGLVLISIQAVGVEPAYADWQYTHWGMTPSQVVAASGGTVRRIKPDGKNEIHLVPKCQGKFLSGHFHFIADFYFDRKTDGLAEIALMDIPDQPSELLKAFEKKYGAWTNGTVWIDRRANYSIEFRFLKSSLTPPISMIVYKPLRSQSDKGL